MRAFRRIMIVSCAVAGVTLGAWGCGSEKPPQAAPLDTGQQAIDDLRRIPADTCEANPDDPLCAPD